MRFLLPIFILTAAFPAQADRLVPLLISVEESQKYVDDLKVSVLPVELRPRVEPFMDASMVPAVLALAIAVEVNGRPPMLLTSGPIAAAAASIRVRAPSGEWTLATGVRLYGEGEVAALEGLNAAFWQQVTPVPMEGEIKVQRTTPVFTIHGAGTPFPVLVHGVVVETFPELLEGVFVTDVAFPHGAPLLTANRTLLGLTFRPHPSDEERSVAVSAEKLRAWVHSEGAETTARAPTPE